MWHYYPFVILCIVSCIQENKPNQKKKKRKESSWYLHNKIIRHNFLQLRGIFSSPDYESVLPLETISSYNSGWSYMLFAWSSGQYVSYYVPEAQGHGDETDPIAVQNPPIAVLLLPRRSNQWYVSLP